MATSNNTRDMNRPVCIDTSDPVLAATLRTAALNCAAQARAAYLEAVFALGSDMDPTTLASELDARHPDAARKPITIEEEAGLIDRHRWDGAKPPQAFVLMQQFEHWDFFHATKRRKN